MSAVPRKPDGGDAIFLLPVRPVVAGTCQREPPRDSLLFNTLLTFIAPDSMKSEPATARSLGADDELPTVAV